MKRFTIIAVALLLGIAGASLRSEAVNTNVKGDYVEVRTASVFAGACHFNGEVTTAGRQALMAWDVAGGSWNGVDLTGVKAIAMVSSDENLADQNAARRSEVVVDSSATRAQALAMVKALETNYAPTLGKVIAVRSEAINFQHQGKAYKVNSADATINVEAMPNDLCCRMPNLVWYDPLVPLQQRKVGYTINALYRGDKVAETWQRADENSAFYGNFSF